MKRDPLEMYRGAKEPKVVQEEKKRQYKEADLHLAFCMWLKKEYPYLLFTRHEREGKRTFGAQNRMKKYNSVDGLPDFELIQQVGDNDDRRWHGLYIEFKKPGESWLEQDGKTVKTQYTKQYQFHIQAWKLGRCAYFCNDIDIAIDLLINYLDGHPLPRQVYEITADKADVKAAKFFEGLEL